MEATHVNWAALPSDLLSCVGALLAVPGRICFRAVCHAWREAIPAEQARAMPAPWVIIPRVEGCSDSFTVLSAPTMNSFRWTPPGRARARCVGSNGSWLAIVTVVDVRNLAISLVNPLTDARVELPLVTGWRWALDTEHDLEFELDVVVRKVAFSPCPSAHDYAAAYVSHCSKAVFCTRAAGTHGWLRLPDHVGGDHEGIRREMDVAYHDGKFYYIGTSGQVWVVDMAAPSPSPVPLDVLLPPFNGMVMCRGYHLAFPDDALHVVWSRSEGDGYPRDCTLRDVVLTRYDPGPDQASGEEQWSPVRRIVGRALLIGDRNQSMSVPVDGNAWLRPNSVYFTNIPLCDNYAIGCLGRRGLWALDVVTGRITWPRAPSDMAGGQLESEWNAWPPTPSDMIELQLESELGVDWARSLWFMPCLTSSR